jgi:hypothetical protein
VCVCHEDLGKHSLALQESRNFSNGKLDIFIQRYSLSGS